MGDPKGFLKQKRQVALYRPVCERVKDYNDVTVLKDEAETEEQASRCMDCGVPFCHWGCPVGNYIPEWNDLIHNEKWGKAVTLLNATNNLPEMTGRVCPAPCEYACVLGLNDDPVTIRENELGAIEYAFKEGIMNPHPPAVRTGKTVAVVGSGPAGLSCAMQLNSAGHKVTVFERDGRPGGILRYGIPDFKLEKWVVDRRVKLMEDEGIEFRTGVNVGVDISAKDVLDEYDAVCLAGGSRVPRDIEIEGRDLKGIHFAMEYLTQSNLKLEGKEFPQEEILDARGKNVVVIGGGDTGSDCVGTANRQGAACVVQIELLPQPGEERTEEHPWPVFPLILKTTSSHEEGAEREWQVLTKRFSGSDAQVKKLECVRVEFERDGKTGRNVIKEMSGSEFEIEADMVVIAAGFLHPEHEGLLESFGVETDDRGNVKTDDSKKTSEEKVFSAGDMRRGQSLVVWAVSEGRKAAFSIDRYLTGESRLPDM